MASKFGKVSVAITASTRGLVRGVATARSVIAGLGRAASAPIRVPLGIGFLAMSKAVEIAHAAVRRLGGAINFMVQSSASLTEQQNRVEKVFGNSANAVKGFAKSASGIGFAEAQALQATGTFGTLFKNIGLADDQSAQFSMNLTRLTADMASFNEVRIDDALRAMRSALVGEVEPIRRLGIVLNDATLRQKAFAMGLTDTTNRVLSPTNKMLAAYASIVEQAKVQQGDFTDTIGTLSNQQRVATSNVRNLAAELGEKLKPVFLAVVSAFNQAMPSIRAFFESMSQTNLLTMLNLGFKDSISLVDVFTGSLRLAAGATGVLFGSFQVLLGVVQSGAGVFGFFTAAAFRSLDSVREVVAAFVTQLEKTLREVFVALTFPVRGLMMGLAEAMRLLGQEKTARGIDSAIKKIIALKDETSGLGKSIQDGLLGELAANAEQRAKRLGEEAAKNIREGYERIKKPLGTFDAAELEARIGPAALDMIPAFGAAAATAVKAISDEVKVSTASLKAIVVDSSAGEAFRNAILRGADPRLAASNDQKIADNTGRMANGIDALPDELASRLGEKMSAASISV